MVKDINNGTSVGVPSGNLEDGIVFNDIYYLVQAMEIVAMNYGEQMVPKMGPTWSKT